jgi:hypothetical protein
MGTELDKEIEEAANIEGNVRDELSVLPIRLHRYPDVHCVCDPSRPCHSFLALLHWERVVAMDWLMGPRSSRGK